MATITQLFNPMVANIDLLLMVVIVRNNGAFRSSLSNIVSKIVGRIAFVWNLMVVLIKLVDDWHISKNQHESIFAIWLYFI
jgi:hypothetical protein